ncbi:hypothetical protein Tco_0497507 [Tanacetum coccineum]
MAAPVISISSNTSEESVGSHGSRVILFGVIPAIIPEVPVVLADPIVTPEVGAVSVVSPSGVLDLVDYSPSSDSDPPEDSLPPAPDFPLVSTFLCSDDSEADGESKPAEQRHVSSSHDTFAPSSEFPLAPVVSTPGIRRRPATLIRPDEAIPFGRPCRTHPNRPHKLLTARKRVRPLPARRLAWRRVSHHSSDHHSSSDLSSSSAPSDHSLSGHTPPDTTDAFRCWRSAPLSTPYPPTTSESSLGSSSKRSLDSSSPSSRPSHKRCRSPTASVPSSTGDLLPPADLLPPRKRFRDSYSPEDSREGHMEVDTADAEAVADVGISDGIVAHPEDGVGMGFEIAASDVREDHEEFKEEASAADTREIDVDPLVISDSLSLIRGGIPDLEDYYFDIVLLPVEMVASGERASLVERIGSLRLEYLIGFEHVEYGDIGLKKPLGNEETSAPMLSGENQSLERPVTVGNEISAGKKYGRWKCVPYQQLPRELPVKYAYLLHTVKQLHYWWNYIRVLLGMMDALPCLGDLLMKDSSNEWWFPAVVVAVVWQWHGEDGSGGSAAAVYPTALWFFENQARLLVRRTGRLVVVGDGTMVGCDDTHKENKGGGDEVAVGRRWVKVAAVGGGAWRRGG